MADEIERCARAEPDGRNGVEPVADVADGLLEPQRKSTMPAMIDSPSAIRTISPYASGTHGP